jgi:carbon-monoxide dehydrogenase large subunit
MHIAAVEVARDTGSVRVLGYWVAHDCGTMLNPMLVDGQLHGGLAQGIGAALSEELRYDEAGQLLSRTFMDYAIPTAETMPSMTIGHVETPSPHTPGGMKGMAEGGTIGAPATIANAVADALAGAGRGRGRRRGLPAHPIEGVRASPGRPATGLDCLSGGRPCRRSSTSRCRPRTSRRPRSSTSRRSA